MLQTYLPYVSYTNAAACLDNKRLGRQRLDCFLILQALAKKTAWTSHPATRMWRGHEGSLVDYYDCVVTEWLGRGFKHEMTLGPLRDHPAKTHINPWWMGIDVFHQSHRAMLLGIDSVYYQQHNWYPLYVSGVYWPVNKHGMRNYLLETYLLGQRRPLYGDIPF